MLAGAGVACGRSVRHQPAPPEAGGAAGTTAGSGPVGGSAGVGSGGVGGVDTAPPVPPKPPLEARHVVVGAPVERGCLSSVAPTATGIRIAGKQNPAPFAGSGEPAAGGGAAFAVETRPEGAGPALTFGDERGQWVAWPSTATSGMSFDFYDAEGALAGTTTTSETGIPLAAMGDAGHFSLAFSRSDALWLFEYRDGEGLAYAIDTRPCSPLDSVAIGAFEDDTVLGYACGAGLLTARWHAATGASESVEVELLDGTELSAWSGHPGIFWNDAEFLFAFNSARGPALARVSPGDATADIVPVTGMPSTAISSSPDNPEFSVVQVGDDIGLTRAACNHHEDAPATGTFDLCRVSVATAEAVCSEVDLPCERGKLVANGSRVTYLGCDGGAPTLVPVALAQFPEKTPGFFPTGHALFAPLALTCDADRCSALLELDSSRLMTGYDVELAFADLEFDAGCRVGTCAASALAPTGVFALDSDDTVDGPNVTVQRQLSDLPLGVITLDGDTPTLSSLDRAGVGWRQPVRPGQSALFAEGDGFLQLSHDPYGVTLEQYTVTPEFDRAGAPLGIDNRHGAKLPGLARCGDRILVHDWSISAAAPHAAIVAFDPQTGAHSELFDPGVYPAPSGNSLPLPLGCAGERVLLLDGLKVHDYSVSGVRRPDVPLATPAPTSFGDSVLTQLETRGDHVLVISASSGKAALDVLRFEQGGGTDAFELPLPPGVVPLVALAVAPDRHDGWLRVLYQSGNETAYATRRGYVYASAYQLSEP